MRAGRIGGCALLVLLALAGSASAAPSGRCDEDKRPIVLMFHPGGFVFDGDGMAPVAKQARRLGLRPRYADYPEFDFPGAIASSRAAARRLRGASRPVVAYGESAGGTLAALLAQRGLVDAAATYSPVANLWRWASTHPEPETFMAYLQADRQLMLRHSPGLHDSDLPIFAMRPVGDDAFMTDATRKWDRRDADVRSVAVPGDHLGDDADPSVRKANVARALAWLRRGTTLTEACSSRR